MSKYLDFRLAEWETKAKVFNVVSKTQGYRLGQIKWYDKWRQYCFFPQRFLDTVFSVECLNDICEFIKGIR